MGKERERQNETAHVLVTDTILFALIYRKRKNPTTHMQRFAVFTDITSRVTLFVPVQFTVIKVLGFGLLRHSTVQTEREKKSNIKILFNIMEIYFIRR